MKITAVKQQVKNPERASVFVDGKYSFSLGLNDLVAEKLRPGFDLDETALKRLKKLSEDGKLKVRALEWVMSRPRSRRELSDYLYRKKADPEQAEAWIEEFTAKGYMSETGFASWLIDMRRRHGKSERAIRAELAKKGISTEVARAAIGEDASETERLQALVAKKRKAARYRADPQKLMALLARQGFRYDDIRAAMKSEDDSATM